MIKETMLGRIATACQMAVDELENAIRRCEYAVKEPRDTLLNEFFDNELVEEIERRGYPVGRKDIMIAILMREMADDE